VVSDGQRLLLDSSLSGDEPFMLATNLPNVAVIVDADRVKAGQYAIQKLGCDTLILDDGFQYLTLKHRFDIVLVDRTNPFGNRKPAAARHPARAHPQHQAGRLHLHHQIQRRRGGGT
jgi:tetraacyldisaccharide 4'-kinase